MFLLIAGVSLLTAVFIAVTAIASQAPLLNPDVARVAEGGNVVIDVLANDTVPDGGFDLRSMYISSEATHGYISIDGQGRISYTHYGGDAVSDSFRYVIASDSGMEGRSAIVMITIGDGDLATIDITELNRKKLVETGRDAVSLAEPLIKPKASVTSNGALSAFHRSGQTFLTWRETSARDSYHVYRHTQPITRDNLASARRLTEKWGPLDRDTSVNTHGSQHVPRHFVINDLEEPLSDSTGLFVYTTQPDDAPRAYYAVTSVRGGRERTLMNLTTSVLESVDVPSDVLTVKTNHGRGRIYTQFMDYMQWNPTFNGYAYNYAVALPGNYDPEKKYPLMVQLHAYREQYKFVPEAEYNWEVIQLFASDPGPSTGTVNSWWYGYSNTLDYRVKGAIPTTGHIENFTEQRLMRAIDAVTANTSVDGNLIYGSGNSMGASGVLALGLRYGSVISGIYANQPMTDYASDKIFAKELQGIWGAKSRNLPVVNRGPHSESIRDVNAGVWDWMNHQRQMVARRGTDMAFLMTLHGKQDRVIEWQTQGKPFYKVLNDTNAGFTATAEEVGHSWVGFSAAVSSLFGFGYDENFPYKYPLGLSFPSIQNASLSGPATPSEIGRDTYNLNIEWATPHTPFAPAIVDQPFRYEVSIRSTEGNQIADVTPRRVRSFSVQPGQRCRYRVKEGSSGEILASGSVIADNDSLMTVKGVPITGGEGSRLVIECRLSE